MSFLSTKSPSSPNKTGLWLAAAAALATAAVVVRSQARRAEQQHPPQGNFLEVDGVRLHYLDRGQGAVVVLLHGNGTMALDFDLAGVVDSLAQKYRVLVFDRPGFGYSTRPTDRRWTPEAQAALLEHALQRLGVSQATVLGHSWGTLVALALALDYPARVTRLVLVSGYYFPTPRLDALLAAPPALPVVGTLLRNTVSPLMGWLMWPALMRRMFGPPKMPSSFAAFPRSLALRPSQLKAAAAESAGMLIAATRLQRRYSELTVPVSILAGDRDRIVDSHYQSQQLHRLLKTSSFTLVPGQGHMLQHLAPETVLAAVG